MGGIRRLRNPIRAYDWGSSTALAELMGRPAPAPGPEAELWMGAHPSTPSEVEEDSGWTRLDAWIARDPRAALGPRVESAFGAELPFLFKVLAPARALSIQTHPDRRQAREGFAREDAAGIPRDAPRRCYRDPQPKPELICAVTRFDALCGFRRRDEVGERFAALGLPALAPVLEKLRSGDARDGLAGMLAALLQLPPEARETLARQTVEAVADADDPALALVAELARQYPGDPGILAPLFLNVITLEPGEALYLAAGELHAYLGGLGVELMGNSDNVLRGGLTSKHVDVPELLRTLTFRQGAPEILMPAPAGDGARRYRTPAEEFELSVLEPTPERGVDCPGQEAVSILLCARGEARILEAGADPLVLARGEAVLVPATVAGFRVEGEAQVFRAGVPM